MFQLHFVRDLQRPGKGHNPTRVAQARCKMFPRVILFAAALCVASTSASSLSPAMALAPATAKQRTVAPLALVLPPDSIAESAQSPLQMHSLIAAL